MPAGDELRSVMRLFPSGVCVVGADAHGDRIAVTIGSLVSLSLDPPLVGISVGKKVKGGMPDPSLAVPIGLGMAL